MDLDPGKGVRAGRKSPYAKEFRNDAVALYRAAGGTRTYAVMAADLGITGETLRPWVRKDTAGWSGSDGRRTCFKVTVQREKGKKPLVARFGGFPLKRQSTVVITDRQPVMATARRNELISSAHYRTM